MDVQRLLAELTGRKGYAEPSSLAGLAWRQPAVKHSSDPSPTSLHMHVHMLQCSDNSQSKTTTQVRLEAQDPGTQTTPEHGQPPCWTCLLGNGCQPDVNAELDFQGEAKQAFFETYSEHLKLPPPWAEKDSPHSRKTFSQQLPFIRCMWTIS